MAFNVIIIGAGPVGLFLANCLQASGIDYVVFEKRSVVPPATAFGIFLWPQVTRMMHQLGLMDSLRTVSHPMTGMVHTSPTGEAIGSDTNFSRSHKTHGYPVVVTDRGSLAQVLLGGLDKPQQHVHTGKRLTNIISRTDGVTVEFADGTSHDGTIVIGGDGIWSTVRDQIRQHTPDGLFLDNPYQASYRGVFGRGPLLEGITSGQGIEVHGQGWLIQAFPSQKETHLFIYKSIPPTSEKVPFSPIVSDDLIEEFADVRLTDKVAFRDVWDKRFAQGTANFEEGVVEMWHWDRMALVGDAAHKISPKQGVAANVGMESAACLTNKLASLLRSNPTPTTQDISTAFSAYQSELEGKVSIWQRLSRFNLEAAVYKNGPQLEAIVAMSKRIPGIVSKSFKLENVPFVNQNASEMPWVY
ncbi:FAD binding domain-containing protein [Metarhizium guizhouense ARSEF 977]|uniref:FAD binding domain-containing protein n=1 Tax=Metarhizium guizhouense (strain ARSEF 977) TaxID=1276136 RepID=A0A0B4GUC3_METGA|nr:FAD binding domain-containing protein [Metarhizium guizhouense ARSEF 977]